MLLNSVWIHVLASTFTEYISCFLMAAFFMCFNGIESGNSYCRPIVLRHYCDKKEAGLVLAPMVLCADSEIALRVAVSIIIPTQV